MWKCAVCDAEIEDDTWKQCWSCMSSRDMDPAAAEELKSKLETPANDAVLREPIKCLRCALPMDHVGTKHFHEGENWGFWFGDLGESFVNRESFEVYCCPKCGKLEFFIEGMGKSLR